MTWFPLAVKDVQQLQQMNTVKLDENVATYLGSPRLPVIYSKAQVHGARTTQGIAVRFTFLAIDLDSVTISLFLEYISNQVYFQF